MMVRLVSIGLNCVQVSVLTLTLDVDRGTSTISSNISLLCTNAPPTFLGGKHY